MTEFLKRRRNPMESIGLRKFQINKRGYRVYSIPAGAKNLCVEPVSGNIHFEVDDEQAQQFFLAGEKDYQFLNPNTGKYVKVDFKRTDGPFKGIPVIEGVISEEDE
jgi:hypothetical protein